MTLVESLLTSYITPSVAARQSGCTVENLTYHIRRGRLHPIVLPGGNRLFSSEEVAKFNEARKAGKRP